MPPPLISIVIPAYNGENYLRDAIDSALRQTHAHNEVIVVNDGSTDSTEAICLSYGNRIRYFSKANGGVSSALNLGIREMRGDYFTWLAHDDMFYPRKLELQIEAIEKSGYSHTIVHGDYDLLNVKHNALSHFKQEDSYSIGQLSNSVFPLLMTTLHGSTPLFHKSHFQRVGLFDENLPLTQDYDFLFRAMRGQKTLFVPQPLLLSRLHGQSNKNTAERFGLACSEQYEHFVGKMSNEEIACMFFSPSAFYCRMAAMVFARSGDRGRADKMLARIAEQPAEPKNDKLADMLKRVRHDKICIFGAGYHGKLLKYELDNRMTGVDYFCDNDETKWGKTVDDTPCLSPGDLEKHMADALVIIAADVSDAIEAQLSRAGFLNIITKKSLDAAILESPACCTL
jgi:glycosyltransferase involved in cell wall biosynthesis